MKSSTEPFIAAIEEVLGQGCTFLDSVGAEVYARPLDGPLGSSLGAHYRHILDHFQCLALGMSTGRVNYDERRRDPQVESSVDLARRMTERLIKEFRGISAGTLQRECMLVYSIGYGSGEALEVASNVAREVIFCVGHAIHHYALLRVLCARLGVELPYEFGIAPSTLRHMEVRVAGEA